MVKIKEEAIIEKIKEELKNDITKKLKQKDIELFKLIIEKEIEKE